MSKMTLDMEELRERWMRVYMNLMILQSHNEKAKKRLDYFKGQAAEFNAVIMLFFDQLEEPV